MIKKHTLQEKKALRVEFTEQFKRIFEQLNTQQRQAVTHIEGPVLVIAGPGTGKTQVLSARIARILEQTDTQPHNILALTFTESAAKNMRDRVVQMIGPVGYYVQITTFHSFCQGVITEHPEYFPIDRTSQPLSDLERFDLFEQLLQSLPLEVLKPLNAPLFYTKEVMKAISDLKREGFSVAAFQELVDSEYATEPEDLKAAALKQWQKVRDKNRELAVLYAAYEARLRATARYDFDDMIALTGAAFAEHDELLQLYQEQLLYILVDEYQDTNAAQNQILTQLASYWGESANIFAVGDPHQSIYRFQGASTENIVEFTTRYPAATVITLSEGYRCPQALSDAAFGLIQQNQLTSTAFLAGTSDSAAALLQAALTQPLQSRAPSQLEPLQLWTATSQTVELIQVAEQIAELRTAGVPAEQIAVLFRTNRDAVELKTVLEKWQIPFELEGGSNVLELPSIKSFLLLLNSILLLRSGAEDGQLLELLLQPYWKLDQTTLFQLSRCAGLQHKKLYELITASTVSEQLTEQGCSVAPDGLSQIRARVDQLVAWGAVDLQSTLPSFFEQLLLESGYLDWVKNHDAVAELLQALTAVFDQVKQLAQSQPTAHLAEFLRSLATMQTHGISITMQGLQMKTGAVTLSTVHKAKGREWQYVFLLHCSDGSWGNTRSRNLLPLPAGVLRHTDISKKERNEDDRRLLYVALTRAKVRCVVSYPQTIVANNRVRDVTASMFISELQAVSPSLEVREGTSLKSSESEYLQRLLTPAPTVAHAEKTRQYLEQVVSEFVLSHSSLTTYLRDPQEFLLSTLLKVPQAKAGYLAFGTAVHAALERLYRTVIAGKEPDFDAVLEKYSSTLKKEVMLPDELSRRLAYGETVLRNYVAQLQLDAVQPWQTEQVFGSGRSQVYLGDIPLTGRIDRFDWIDAEKKLVRVVDYKTGGVKTVGDIEGTTVAAQLSEREQQLPPSIRGQYKRQLLFYKLLTDLDPSFTATVTTGTFEFIEPQKESGTFVTRQFELHEQDVAYLATLITEVMKEIRELRFLDAVQSS